MRSKKRDSELTVFVGTFNRTDTLKRCLDSLERQEYPTRIVIVDNGSRDAAALQLLDQLEDRYTVHRLPGADDVPEQPVPRGSHGGHGMMTVQRNYTEAFQREGMKTRWFAVCDADSAPDGPPDSIERYMTLAGEFGGAVGPHLSLNVHSNYPLRSAALILNARVLFRDRMEWHAGIPYTFDDIDSTFHLFPATGSFERLKMRTIRVGPPWWATHTDWLIDLCNPTEENHAYILGSGDAAAWAGNWIRDMFAAWLRSPREAFKVVKASRSTSDDYYWPGFILSWMLQYGHGCEIDLDRSRAVLRASFPDWSPCWNYEQHWDDLVYEDDQSCLGWAA